MRENEEFVVIVMFLFIVKYLIIDFMYCMLQDYEDVKDSFQ